MNRRGLLCAAAAAALLGPAACATQTAPSPVDGVSLRMVETNGITLRVAEIGEGPLIIMVHGWPESWFSWRHQMPVLAAAGYKVIAPDMRGYGGSDKPDGVENYDIHHVTADLVGLVDAYGAETATLVGHDWGSIVGWNAMLLHPDRFNAYAAMSVPNGGRGAVSPIQAMRAGYGDNFYYILYFQEPGVAEAEFDADPRGILSSLYVSKDTPTASPQITDPKRAAGGWIPRRGAPLELPTWLTQQELDYYVDEFTRAGFEGGINYYRNFHRNWETTPQLTGATIDAPVTFIAGVDDVVIGGADEARLTAQMSRVANDLRGVTLIDGAGHWVQQEKPEEVNAALLNFLAGL